jgi:hypothetical protein
MSTRVDFNRPSLAPFVSDIQRDGAVTFENLISRNAAKPGPKPVIRLTADPEKGGNALGNFFDLVASGQYYQNELNALAVGLMKGVNTSNRTLTNLTDGQLGKHYKTLILVKLTEQGQRGEQLNLGKAFAEVNKELFEGVHHAAQNAGADADGIVDVIRGYWDRHEGKSHAIYHAVAAFEQVRLGQTATDDPDFDDNLNALASLFVSGTITDGRKLAVGLDDRIARQLYKNLITAELKKQGYPANLSEAMSTVDEELFKRIGNAAANAGDEGGIVDVIRGYWDRHGGKEAADTLAREALEEFVSNSPPSEGGSSDVNPDANFEDELNAVAAALAAGINVTNHTVTPLTDDDIRDHFANLIYAKLKEQQANGGPVDLDAAYDAVREEVSKRIPNALRDDPAPGQKLDILNEYWDQGGKSDAARIAHEAYGYFLAKNVQTDNPNYEDNLNALAVGLGGGTIDDTRTLSPLKDPTLGKLYKNLITSKLAGGIVLDDAITQVNDELFNRLPNAGAGGGKLDIIRGYWDRHGGQTDAKRLAEAAYSSYVAGTPDGGDSPNILESSATDFLNAETVGGKTVFELYIEKLRKAWENEPKDSDKAKYLRLLDAQAALGGSFEYFPYVYNPDVKYTGYSSQPIKMTEVEALGLLDENKIAQELQRLAVNEAIATDLEKFLSEAASEIKDKKGLEDRIVATLLSPAYEQELLDAGGDEKALQRFASDIFSLRMLNPEKADEIQQQLSFGSVFSKLSEILSNPDLLDGLSQSDFQLSLREIVYKMVQAEFYAAYGAEAGLGLWIAYQDRLDGKKFEEIRINGKELTRPQMDALRLAEATTKAQIQLFKDLTPKQLIDWVNQDPDNRKTYTETFANERKITQAIQDAYVEEDLRSKVSEKIRGLSASGALTTAGGMGCLAAGIMILTKDGGKDLTTADRLNAAFNLLFAGSGIPQAASQVTGGLEKLLKIPGMKEAIGLDKNFNNVWETSKTTSANAKLWSGVNRLLANPAGDAALKAFQNLPENTQVAVLKRINGIAKNMGNAVATLSATDKLKLIGPGLKVLADVGYLAGGIIGTYVGAIGIRDAQTPEDKATASLGLGAGLFWSGAAGISFVSRFVSAGLSATLGTVGAALGAIGLFLSVVAWAVGAGVEHIKQDRAAEKIRDVFRDWERDGITESGWGDKFNYLIQMRYVIGALGLEWYHYYFPENMTPWEAQPEHFRSFVENGQAAGDLDWYQAAYSLLKGHGEKPVDTGDEDDPTPPYPGVPNS